MKMFKAVTNEEGGQEIVSCDCDREQRDNMKDAGWSATEPQIDAPDPVAEQTWTCLDCGNVHEQKTKPKKCKKCGEKTFSSNQED